jgi:hypothetical protein
MTVPWKAWKTKYGFFHASHRPLKIPQNRRDFHIPTAQACTAWKSGKPTTGFPLSHPVHAMTTTVLSLNRKTKRKEVGRYAASSFFMPLSLRSSGTDFMLILQLENARGRTASARFWRLAISVQTQASCWGGGIYPARGLSPAQELPRKAAAAIIGRDVDGINCCAPP